MTNEEINLAIAAIQGFTYVPPEKGRFGKMTYPKWRHSGGAEYVSETPPPYATDWQWCGPLVEKFDVDLWRHVETNAWTACIQNCKRNGISQTATAAICLAVIAAQPILATLPLEAPIRDSDRS